MRSFYRDIDEFCSFILGDPTQEEFETKLGDFSKKAKHVEEYIRQLEMIARDIFPNEYFYPRDDIFCRGYPRKYPYKSISFFGVISMNEGKRYPKNIRNARFFMSLMKDELKDCVKEARKLYYKLKSLDSSLYLFMYHMYSLVK